MLVSNRISKLKNKTLSRTGFVPEWYLLKAESLKNTWGQHNSIRLARALAFFLERVPIDIDDDELIVGRFIKRQPTTEEEKDINEAMEYICDQSELLIIPSGVQPHGGSGMQIFLKRLSEMADADFESWDNEGIFTIFPIWHHSSPDARKLLNVGLEGIEKEIRGRLSEKKLGEEQKIFLDSALICVNAASDFINRFSLLAEKRSETENRKERINELKNISKICKKISRKQADNFHEAVQLLWFQYVLMNAEICSKFYGSGLGQLDRVLIDYYDQDIKENFITRDFACELIQNLFISINYADSRGGILPLIVGGLGPDKKDASNEITGICLDSMRSLNLLNPSLALRYHKDMPRNILKKAVDMWGAGIGHPQVFNDDVVFSSLVRSGVKSSDIYEYVHSVCTEITVIGKTNGYISAPYFNMVKPLELIINNGNSLMTNKKLSEVKGTLSYYKSFNELFEDYLRELSKWIRLSVMPHNLIEEVMKKEFPQPFISICTGDCIEKAKDYTDGGARYNPSYIQATGISTLVDSLLVIRDLVFEGGRIPANELLKSLKSNFKGYEKLQVIVRNHKNKYGNDIKEADDLFKKVSQHFFNEVRKYKNTRGGSYYPGFMVWESHNILGQKTGATPDGRLSGRPLSDSVGAVQGMDRNGLTALFNSVTRTDYSNTVGGVTLNVRLMPSLFSSEEERKKILDAVRCYFDMGGFHIQVNAVDGAILEDAKIHPEKHQNLMVRVGGFSAYFITLDKNIQDEIILRHQH